MPKHKYRYSKGGMTSVKSDDGEDLMYNIDTDEKYIEVDENTKKYLSDIALVMDRNFRKLKDTYIFWYDDMSDSDITELEEVFQTSFNKYADGGEISEDLSNYVRLYFKAKLDSDTASSNGNLAHSIRLDDKADDYRNDAMRLIDDYNKKNNTNLSIYDFNRNGILKLHIEQIEEYFDLEYIGEYGNKMRFINKNDGSILEINVSSNPKDAIMRYYEENFKYGGKMAYGGNVEDLNVYTLVSSKEYFGTDTASDKRRWFRRNGRGLTRDQAKRMAQDYIDRYGKERVYIGNIRHYR